MTDHSIRIWNFTPAIFVAVAIILVCTGTASAAVPPVFSRSLGEGWSILSTPVQLAPANNTFGTVFDAASREQIETVLGWDGQAWYTATDSTRVEPLNAYYVLVNTSATATFVPLSGASSPPVRQLGTGLYLIGPAPPFDGAGFNPEPLETSLISISEAPGGLTGYVMVISPPYGQCGWSYARGGSSEQLYPFRGYWIVMNNPALFAGFSLTPLQPVDVFTVADNGTTVQEPVGVTFKIRLQTNPSTGAIWITNITPGLNVTGITYLPVTERCAGIAGAPSIENWDLKVKEEGPSRFTAVYRQPWMPETGSEPRFVLDVDGISPT
jgi:predicted secreted protein